MSWTIQGVAARFNEKVRPRTGTIHFIDRRAQQQDCFVPVMHQHRFPGDHTATIYPRGDFIFFDLQTDDPDLVEDVRSGACGCVSLGFVTTDSAFDPTRGADAIYAWSDLELSFVAKGASPHAHAWVAGDPPGSKDSEQLCEAQGWWDHLMGEAHEQRQHGEEDDYSGIADDLWIAALDGDRLQLALLQAQPGGGEKTLGVVIISLDNAERLRDALDGLLT